MAHAPIIVLIPALVQDIEQEVERLLAPYYQGLEVEPYLVRPSSQEIQRMLEYYETDELEEIAEYLNQWINCYESGIDEEGLYGICDYNPQTKWDSWKIDRNLFDRGDKNIITVAEFLDLLERNRNNLPFAVVEPYGTWHGEEDVKPINANEKHQHIWLQKIISILNHNLYARVVFCDLHV